MTAERVRAAAGLLRAQYLELMCDPETESTGDLSEPLADLLEQMAQQLAVAERLGIETDELALPEYTALGALVERIEEASR